ncbi:MAG: hypothetical protein GY814_04075 [Gammaproteobacteria bacterium]|nr:hypothetical protein [Gammaproteobacteria bacterium]
MADKKETGAVQYKTLQQKHPDYNEDYWARCRVFYKGGRDLLENVDMMRRVFPQHRNEDNQIYAMRRQMAHYTNYAGEIIDELLAKLNSDPLRLESEDADPYYPQLLENCAPPGAKTVRFGDLLQQLLLTAMQCGRAWVLVDLPPADPYNEAGSLLEQELAGRLNAWCVEVQPESVIDWEADRNGVLEWAMICYKSRKRHGVTDSRDQCKETYLYYTADEWIKWEVVYSEEAGLGEEGAKPKDEDLIRMTDRGFHNFGRVPLQTLNLPEGLWAMGKLESLAREHFNKRCALSWAEFKALMPVLYEFHDNSPENQALGGEGGDIDRAYNQPRSTAHVQVRNSGDRVEWAAPPAGSFSHALESCKSVRDEMHRVVHQMARSADMNKAAIRRSGESKALDENGTNIVLDALGDIVREFAKELLLLVAIGRKDQRTDWIATGLSNFQEGNVTALLDQEAMLDAAVEVPSSMFKQLRKFQIAKKVLGDAVRESDLETIKKEIQTFYTHERELESFGLNYEPPEDDQEPVDTIPVPEAPGKEKDS